MKSPTFLIAPFLHAALSCFSFILLKQDEKYCSSNGGHLSFPFLLNPAGGLPCELEGILESPLVNGYRNKCEFSVGYSVQGKLTVGFMLGNFRYLPFAQFLEYFFLSESFTKESSQGGCDSSSRTRGLPQCFRNCLQICFYLSGIFATIRITNLEQI